MRVFSDKNPNFMYFNCFRLELAKFRDIFGFKGLKRACSKESPFFIVMTIIILFNQHFMVMEEGEAGL
jgi:hypothetical protein